MSSFPLQELPIEIFRRILRCATAVDDVEEPGFVSSYSRDENTLPDSISRSMATKCSLSLVSKVFQSLMHEFLFEIIRVRNYSIVRPLANLLRAKVPGKPCRGWWCRRLELILEFDDDRSWTWGAFTFGGLLPACPRLADLRCHVDYWHDPRFGEDRTMNLDGRFRISDVLLKLIASNLSTTLHRLDFTGQSTVLFEDMQTMLLSLDQLEVCRILGLNVLDPADPSITPDLRLILNEHRPTLEDLANCEDPEEKAEYALAQRQASWPAAHRSKRLTPNPLLPRLHTLHISDFTSKISKWHMPSLVTIGAGFGSPFHTPTERADEIKMGVIENITNIKGLVCYCSRGEGIDLWSLLGALPNLETLEYHIQWTRFEGSLSVPSARLHSVTIYRSLYNGIGHYVLLQRLYDYHCAGLLPALKRICITGWQASPPEPFGAIFLLFAAMGISVESSVTNMIVLVDTDS